MERAVFLDRDGVLSRSAVRNGRPYAPTTLEEFELIPGVPEAVVPLHEARFRLIVVTNQPDLGAGRISPELVERMHRLLCEWLPLDDVKVCPHRDEDGCDCRKPKPGMLLTAAREWNIDLTRSFMVGDRWRDVSAGKAAGCRTILVDHGYDEPIEDKPDFVVASLFEASQIILYPPGEYGLPAT